MAGVAHVWPVRARLPRRRGVRARMGVLEGVRGPARDGPSSATGDEALGNGISEAKLHEDALFVKEAQLSMMRRLGGSENSILIAQSNLANTYQLLKRHEEAMCLRRDVYSGRMKLNGEEHRTTLVDAFNYALSLLKANRFAETKSLMRKTIPVARRVLGENDRLTLKMRQNYARALYKDPAATLDDLREAVTTLAETERTARRLLGGAHPLTTEIGDNLRLSRATLHACETVKAP